MAGEMNAKKIQTWFLVHLVRIAAPKRKQKPWMEARRTLTMSRVAPLKKKCKENVCSRMGGGGGLQKNFFRPFGPHFGLRAPSLDLPLFYRGNTSSAFDKKKKNSPLSFSNFLELFSRRPRIVFKLDNILWETKHTTQPTPNVKLLAVSYRLL